MSNDVKDIEINGCITIPTNITHDEFLKKFNDICENMSKNITITNNNKE